MVNPEIADDIINNLLKKKIIAKIGEQPTFTEGFIKDFITCIRISYDNRAGMKVDSFDKLLSTAMFGAIGIWNDRLGLHPQEAELQEEYIACMGLAEMLNLKSKMRTIISGDKALYAHLKDEGLI